MRQYLLSELFTLIPQEFYTPQFGKNALEEQFSMGDGYVFKEHVIQQLKTVVSYAIPQNKDLKGSGYLPLVVRLIEEAGKISEYNKVVFHYNKGRNLSHTIIAAGKDLKIANSFSADSFESALYFLFLSIQQLQMNPKQCTVRVCSAVTKDEEEIIRRFFNGVEKNNLDNLILV